MKKNRLAMFIILFLLTGCKNEKNASSNKEMPKQSIISSIRLTQSDRRSSIVAELCYDENIILRLDTLEVIIKTGLNDSNIAELKNRYSLIDAGNGIIAVLEKVPSVQGEYMVFDLYEYSDELIRKVWSSSDLSAQIQNIDTGCGQVDLYIPKFDISHKLQLTKDELNSLEQKIVELRNNNVKIDNSYYLDIKDNLLMNPIAYHITSLNDNSKQEVIILIDVHTVGAKTPYIRDRAIIKIKNDNGVISTVDIVFERELTEDKSPFAYFS